MSWFVSRASNISLRIPGVFFFTKKMLTVDLGTNVNWSSPVARNCLHKERCYLLVPASILQVYGVMGLELPRCSA